MTSNTKKIYYFLAFLEGGTVMAAELLGAKMMAPFFGTSLYVWSSIMATTLGGLALGYFAGGYLSSRKHAHSWLMYLLFSAAVFTIAMPFFAQWLFPAFDHSGLIISVIIAAVGFLMPPVFLLGMVSPFIIRLTTDSREESGRIAGNVYAVSTLGGIIITFLFGFYIIPTYGLFYPAIYTGCILGIIPAILLWKQHRFFLIAFVLLIAVIAVYRLQEKKQSAEFRILYHSEGLLGQIMVIDRQDTISKETQRMLLVNRTLQAEENIHTKGKRYVHYIHEILDKITAAQPGSRALILGLGSGALANDLINKGYQVDACELDERIVQVARTFFHLSPEVNVIREDARRVLRTSSLKYDWIVFDLYRGEESPYHLFTTEALEEAKTLLTSEGKMVFNLNGFLTGSTGKGNRAILKTIVSCGFYVELIPTPGKEAERNLLVWASLKKSGNGNTELLSGEYLQPDDQLLNDNTPALDMLNAAANKAWRTAYIHAYTEQFRHHNIPLFN